MLHRTIFFKQINKHKDEETTLYIDQETIDWQEVESQILQSCFSDHDMEGYNIVPRRVESELSAFRALQELPHEIWEEY